MRGNARIFREKVKTPPPPSVLLIEKQHRFILRGVGFAWKCADFPRKSGNAPHRSVSSRSIIGADSSYGVLDSALSNVFRASSLINTRSAVFNTAILRFFVAKPFFLVCFRQVFAQTVDFALVFWETSWQWYLARI